MGGWDARIACTARIAIRDSGTIATLALLLSFLSLFFLPSLALSLCASSLATLPLLQLILLLILILILILLLLLAATVAAAAAAARPAARPADIAAPPLLVHLRIRPPYKSAPLSIRCLADSDIQPRDAREPFRTSSPSIKTDCFSTPPPPQHVYPTTRLQQPHLELRNHAGSASLKQPTSPDSSLSPASFSLSFFHGGTPPSPSASSSPSSSESRPSRRLPRRDGGGHGQPDAGPWKRPWKWPRQRPRKRPRKRPREHQHRHWHRQRRDAAVPTGAVAGRPVNVQLAAAAVQAQTRPRRRHAQCLHGMPQEASQGEPCCERELEAGETLWPRV